MTDLFISHASEDKTTLVQPLADALLERGLSVWYDNYTLTLGDSLVREIERGLQNCRFGVVVLSPHFFAKEWPRVELDALITREISERTKRILPVWHNVDRTDVERYSPLLASRLAVSSSRQLADVVASIETAVGRTDHRPTIPHQAGPLSYLVVQAPNFGRSGGPGMSWRFRLQATITNRSTRAAVLSMRLRWDLPADDERKWIQVPEASEQEGKRFRVEAENFATHDLEFVLHNPESYGGEDLIGRQRAWLMITDHITGARTQLRVPTPM